MSVTTAPTIHDDLLEDAWKLYQQSFDSLRYRAAARHVMYASEFDAVMADARITKYLAHDDNGMLQGASTMTSDLTALPFLSPEYFAHRWPERYQAGQIFYIGFMAVHPDFIGSGIFGQLVERMTKEVADVDGLAVVDVCADNKDRLHLPRALNSLASTWAPQVQMSTLDTQYYIGYDFARTA
jgi:GNAT superfamily N-acetyltransferase